MSITTSSARAASRAKRRRVNTAPVNFDPAANPIIARHWFGVEPLHPIGPIAAEIVADVKFRHQVERLYRLGPRVVGEAFAHIGIKHSIRTSVEQTVEHFTELEPEVLEAAGGDEFWQPPIHGVER